MLDRITPTHRPEGRANGTQSWRSLLFMHWPVPVDVMRRLVPEPLELDLWEGTAYIGVVPFKMQRVRPKWLPPAFAFEFLEANVRTYVYHGNQPGVYFFSLEAASALAVWCARQFWGLPYYYAHMNTHEENEIIQYESVRRHSGAKHKVRYRIGEKLGPTQPETLEFFFLERYVLFVERQRQLLAGRVYHQPYPAHLAEVLSIEDELMLASGFEYTNELPHFAHYSPGVDVETFDLQPVS